MSDRRTKLVTIPKEWGARDAGKMYLITERSALFAEKWGHRLFLAVKGTTAEVPLHIASFGFVGAAIVGLNSVLAADVSWEKLEPLYDELLQCVQMVRDPRFPDAATPLDLENDFSEMRTIAFLRLEVLSLHANFSLSDDLWNWWESQRKILEDMQALSTSRP